MRLFRFFLSIFILIGFVVTLSAQEIDDEEQEVKPEDLKTIEEKVVLPIQPPKPKPTPIEIQPIEPKAESFQRFAPSSPVTPPERREPTPPSQFWFKQPTPVTAPDYHNPHNPNGTSSMPFKQPDFLANIPSSNPGSYQPEYGRMPFQEPHSIQGASSVYSTARLDDFSGGLNLVDFPNKIADNEAVNLTNFIWTSAGKLKPRPGFRKYNISEFDAGKRIWGLYPYTTPDGEDFLLAGVNGTLWADTTDYNTGSFVSVKTGLQSNSKYYDFETFKGKAIVAHEGDYPFILGKDVNETIPTFGFADSIIWAGRHGNACTTFIEAENVNWQPGQWAGFVLSRSLSPHDTNTLIIADNSSDELTILYPTNDAILTWGLYRYIFGFFDYDSVTSGVIDSARIAPSGCTHDIYSGNWSESWEEGSYFIRMTSGTAQGNQRKIKYVDDANGEPNIKLIPQHAFNDTLKAGDSYVILKAVFWIPCLCEVYKHGVFFVTENQYPATGQDFVVFSENNKLTHFDQDNSFTVKTEDGDKITALATFYDDQLGYKDRSRDCLVIFKQNSIWKLVWESATNYYLVQVSDNVGCIAPQSVVNVEGKYLLFLHTTGVYAFDGRMVTLISGKIQPLIDDMNQHINMAAGGYYKDHYYLSYTNYGNGYNRATIVFNVKTGAWAMATKPWTGLFAQQTALSDSCKLLFAHYYDNSFIYEFAMATTDTGEAIPLTYKSKAFDFNSIADRKRFTYFDLDYNLTSGNFTTYFYTDFGDSLKYNKTVSESGGYRYSRIPLDSDCLGRNFSFKITSSNKLELDKVGIKFKKIKE